MVILELHGMFFHAVVVSAPDFDQFYIPHARHYNPLLIRNCRILGSEKFLIIKTTQLYKPYLIGTALE